MMASAQPDAVVPQRPSALWPALGQDQKEQIFAAAGELLRASLAGRPALLPDPGLGGAADRTVSGAFVSLTRGRHLRSCCGVLGQDLALGQALQQAADRTAWEDVRFPPVSPTELDHLDMEVWLLCDPEPVEAQGEERLGAVTVGKHGLKVIRGPAQGLLLPGVPLEHNWDVRRFLEQVCVKAGLHPTAWKDAATLLFTFEGESIRGRVTGSDSADGRGGRTAPFAAKDLPLYADFCHGNIAAALTGATPNYYLFGRPDGFVAGLALMLRRPGAPTDFTLSQLSLRPGLPLQGSLFRLAQGAAQVLAQQGVVASQLPAWEVGLAVFLDPVLHGTVADCDLAGADWERRAILVVERSRTAVVYDAGRPPEQLLAEAVRQAKVRHPDAATVFSLEALATEPRVAVASVPRPTPGPDVRPPAAAGAFYPADAATLERLLDELIGERGPPEPWPAALVPHAGWPFSGRIAAGVFKRLRLPRTLIMLGPKHTPLGTDWAVAPHQVWALPGRPVATDPELARQLAEAIPGLELDALAHQREHGVEVELPFIARLAPEARVVGIAIGDGDWDSCRAFAEGLAGVLRQREDCPLLVVSSDMNHYATDAETRRLDELALVALEQLDPKTVYDTVTENSISMCGYLPAVIVLETLRLLGRLNRAERVSYATSADVTGDPSRVVGYAGMLWG